MNFQWAMDQLRENKRVRRASWAREMIAAGTKLPGDDGGPDYIVSKDYTLVWHLFMMDGFIGKDFWEAGIINGWGGSIGGADDDDPVRDGMVYAPTDADRAADDWELHSDGCLSCEYAQSSSLPSTSALACSGRRRADGRGVQAREIAVSNRESFVKSEFTRP